MKRIFKTASALVLVLAGLLGQSAPTPAALPHETPDTPFEREALALVQILEQQPETIRSCFALPACAERALTGLRLNPRLTQRFGTNLSDCFEETLAGPMASAAHVKIVSFHREGGEPRFLCRAAQRDGSIAYLDLIVERSRRAGCAVVDAFDYSAGLKLSEMARGTIEARAQESQKTDHQWLLSSRSESSKFANEIDHFQQLARNGDFPAALAAYSKLPPAAQKGRMNLRTQIRCATTTDLPACSTALALWRATFPNDGATDLLSLDYLKRKKLHDAYLDAIERIDHQFGGDAYLDVVRARYCQEHLPGERSEQFARQAVQRDPTLREAHQTLVSVLLEKKDFEAAGRAMSVEEKVLATDLGPAVGKAARENGTPLAEFARSEAGRRWLVENEKQQAQVAAQAESEATSANGQFKLEAISTAGGRAVATINGRTVGLGDRLLGGTRVSRIGPHSINLVSTNGEVETLTLRRGLSRVEETVLPR